MDTKMNVLEKRKGGHMLNELWKKYRPTTFSEIVGQDDCVVGIRKALKRGFPQASLFTGNSGVGKTTCARILSKELGACGRGDYTEINAASSRGIDTIREIEQTMQYSPAGGHARVCVFDECFPVHTLVYTPEGATPIGEMKIGDTVCSIAGDTKVSAVFKNKVNLLRLVKLHFSDGSSLITTKQHKFLSLEGWIEAQHAKNVDFFTFPSYLMTEGRKYDSSEQNVCVVQKKLYPRHFSIKSKQGTMLQQVLCKSIKRTKKRTRPNKNCEMQRMWKDDYIYGISSKDILQSILCCKEQNKKTRDSCCFIQPRNKKENRRCSDGKEKTFGFSKNENKQSDDRSKNYSKDDRNQNEKWNFAHLERRTWREWKVNYTTEKTSRNFREGLADRISHSNKTKISISQELQSRFGKQEIEVSSRSRWENAPLEKNYVSRCQKDKLSKRVRVESIEIYQPGSNDESFRSVISSTDLHRGFVEFYDLQIEGHPSYFAEGFPVHNCHSWTSDAQNALLKILEDPPQNVYFVLCTTDATKLKKTIKTRCTPFDFKPIAKSSLLALMQRIMEKEEVDDFPSDKVLERIIEAADGSARQAIVLLEKVIELEDETQQLAAIKMEDDKDSSWELFKLLIWKKPSWNECKELIVKCLEQDQESLRRRLLASAATTLLKKDNKPFAEQRLFVFLQEFGYSWIGKEQSGLIEAVYSLTQRGSK